MSQNVLSHNAKESGKVILYPHLESDQQQNF